MDKDRGIGVGFYFLGGLLMKTEFVREVSLRYKGRKEKWFSAIRSPENAACFVRSILPDNVKEHFVALFLNAQHEVVAYSIVATGMASSCPVHPREVYQPAIIAGACAILVAHSNPSGTCEPSADDKAITKRLKEAGELLGIPLLDHVIVTDYCFYSFNDQAAL